MRLDLATVLVQWSAGTLAGAWVTTRLRVISTGYGWLVRGVGLGLALAGAAAGIADADSGAGATIRDAGAIAMAAVVTVALVVSVLRRRVPVGDAAHAYPPQLDLLAPVVGVVALLGAADAAGGSFALAAARLLVGALFLGCATDSMLLGHWYLVQPGLSREPVKALVRLLILVWPLEVALLLVPPGMVSVLSGEVDDGYGGLLGWTWVVSALTTLALAILAKRALEERYYSAVMAATGLLYLGILTAFGTDVLSRALIA